MGQGKTLPTATLRKDSMEADSMSGAFEKHAGNPIAKPSDAVDLEDFVLTNTLARLHEQIASDAAAIPGYTEFQHYAHLAFDVEAFEFFAGDDDYQKLDERLAEDFGPEYSLRYHIITINE